MCVFWLQAGMGMGDGGLAGAPLMLTMGGPGMGGPAFDPYMMAGAPAMGGKLVVSCSRNLMYVRP